MTATEELRRMLDERGVEWMPVAWNPKRETFYHAANGVGFCANEYTDGVKIYTDATITPEQAIAATLGATDARPTQEESSGTCHVESSIIDTYEYNRWEYELSCGHTIIWEDSEPPRYCPECGRRIEQ